MKKLYLTLLVALSTTVIYCQTVRVDSISSKILGRIIPTTIILPKNYEPDKTYAVFYFLHFFGGNNESYTDINLLASLNDKPVIIVTPSADTCWYVNSYSNPLNRYEDFLTSELFNYIDRKYKTYPAKQAIGGTSMGGFGALMIGLKHPERFKFIADLSGAINAPFTGTPVTPYLKPILNATRYAFGDSNSLTTKNSDIFTLTRNFRGKDKPYIFMAIGNHDEFGIFLQKHQEYLKLLKEKNFRYEYIEIYGGHFTGEVRWAVTPHMFLKMLEILKL